MAADNLKKLHTSLIDNRNGYEEAAKDAETLALKTFFTEMIALKERDHSELHAGLSELGEEPDEAGFFISTVHKTVISIRACHWLRNQFALVVRYGRRAGHEGV